MRSYTSSIVFELTDALEYVVLPSRLSVSSFFLVRTSCPTSSLLSKAFCWSSCLYLMIFSPEVLHSIALIGPMTIPLKRRPGLAPEDSRINWEKCSLNSFNIFLALSCKQAIRHKQMWHFLYYIYETRPSAFGNGQSVPSTLPSTLVYY